METLAMNKSKRYIVMGACFLPPSSLLIYSKGHYPSILCASLLHFICTGGLGDVSLCMYVTFPHQLREIWVYISS